jgi:hypothetical protein
LGEKIGGGRGGHVEKRLWSFEVAVRVDGFRGTEGIQNWVTKLIN